MTLPSEILTQLKAGPMTVSELSVEFDAMFAMKLRPRSWQYSEIQWALLAMEASGEVERHKSEWSIKRRPIEPREVQRELFT